MTITGVCGDIGSGKSFYQLKYALDQCNAKHKRLVCNFKVNIPALKAYASASKMPYLIWLADNRQIACIPSLSSLTDLFTYPDSIVCLDEAGIFLNSREFSKTPKSLLSDLAQSRKQAIDLIYAAQFDAQVDKQFRMLTQYFIHCDGLTRYDRKSRRPKLEWQYYSHFKSAAYWRWVEDYRARSSSVRTYMSAFQTTWGPLSKADKLLFSVFDSYSRLDSSATTQFIASSIVPVPHVTTSNTQSAQTLRSYMLAFHKLPFHQKLAYPKFLPFYFKHKSKYPELRTG